MGVPTAIEIGTFGRHNFLGCPLVQMRCAPHTLRHAEAHTPGTQERLTLISGYLEAGPEGATLSLAPGDSVTFPADQPHLYRTQAAEATLLLTVTYGLEGTRS